MPARKSKDEKAQLDASLNQDHVVDPFPEGGSAFAPDAVNELLAATPYNFAGFMRGVDDTSGLAADTDGHETEIDICWTALGGGGNYGVGCSSAGACDGGNAGGGGALLQWADSVLGDVSEACTEEGEIDWTNPMYDLPPAPKAKAKAAPKASLTWSTEEQRLFAAGLEKHGRGKWRAIAAEFVHTRTPTQVASHAQKYFIKLHRLSAPVAKVVS